MRIERRKKYQSLDHFANNKWTRRDFKNKLNFIIYVCKIYRKIDNPV